MHLIRGVVIAVLCASAWGALANGTPAPPILYSGEGGWMAVAGQPATTPPADGPWAFADGAWVARVADDFSPPTPPLALPPPVVFLPPTRSAFGDCTVRSLGVRFDSVTRSRKWSLVFALQKENPTFEKLAFLKHPQVSFTCTIEDVDSGQIFPLNPERRGREGGMLPSPSDARFYGGMLADHDLDWTIIVLPLANGRFVFQGQLQLLKSDHRRFRLRLDFQTGAPGIPLWQTDECPPAILSLNGINAFAIFPDLAEPRRFRAGRDTSDSVVIEFDLAVTKATGNFPRRATFSMEVGAWRTTNEESAHTETAALLARAGGAIAVPPMLLANGLGDIPVVTPSAQRLSHPGGFDSSASAMNFLLLKTSKIFAASDEAASAFQCIAISENGEPQMTLSGDTALLAINADPDLPSMLEWGPNRGWTVLARIRQSGAPAAFIRAGIAPALDYNPRSLHLCDYPAIWGDDSPEPATDVRHAEAELISSLACTLKKEGICLLVEDSGSLAPFTTVHADALVCASSEEPEMRRQHALAGPRPVLWTAENPSESAQTLARDLGFVRPGKIGEN